MRNGGIENVVVSKELIDKCERAHSKYEAYLAESKKQQMR